jgi:hypothetical protein
VSACQPLKPCANGSAKGRGSSRIEDGFLASKSSACIFTREANSRLANDPEVGGYISEIDRLHQQLQPSAFIRANTCNRGFESLALRHTV